MTNEKMEEAVSRVAAALTAVPHDQDFTARMNQRIDAGGTASWLWVAPAMAVAVLVLVVAATVDQSEQTAPLPSRPIAVTGSLEALPPAIPQPIGTTTALPPRSTKSHSGASRESLVPAIAALAEPETLSVDALIFASLSVAPVELDVLDVPGLEVRDIEAAQPKEQ